MDVRDRLKEMAEKVDPLLLKYMGNEDPKIGEMLAHPIQAGGKRLRPALVLLAAEAVGGDPQKALPAAASVELLHTFTLVHDDIMDADSERRGKPTVHALWGESMGILVGDTLYSKAFEAIVDERDEGVDADRVLDAVGVFNWANTEIHGGQMLDMMFEDRDDVTEKEYTTMIEKKTAALIEACTKIGGIVGGGTDEQATALGAYGRKIGTAFQIQDDLLDLTADEKKLGKPVGSDIREGKKSIIVIHALANAEGGDREKIENALGNPDLSEEGLKEVIDTLNNTGSIEYARKKLGDLIDGAKNELTTLPESEAKDALAAIADYVVERVY